MSPTTAGRKKLGTRLLDGARCESFRIRKSNLMAWKEMVVILEKERKHQ